MCAQCQTPYAGRAVGSICDKCGGRLLRRRDDEPDAIRNRLAVYKEQTEPVLAWYRGHGIRVIAIDATGTTDAVLTRAIEALER